jgi:hypothetical protein
MSSARSACLSARAPMPSRSKIRILRNAAVISTIKRWSPPRRWSARSRQRSMHDTRAKPW